MKGLTNTIAAASMLAVAGLSQAVSLNPRGHGDALIYPLYTTGDNDTLITLANDADQSTIARMRFLDRFGGIEVAIFDVYLGPFDTWAGAVSGDGGLITITAADETCTVPAFEPDEGGVPRFAVDTSRFADDPLPDFPSRTAFGYVEVIEIARVDGGTADLVVARDCDALTAAWDDGGYLANNPQTDMLAPGGNLAGSGWVIDVLGGEAYEYDALALAGFSSASRSNQPGSVTPDLSSLDTASSGQYVATVVTKEGAMDLAFEHPEDAISALITQTSVGADFSLDPALFAAASLYLTAPTMRYYVSANHVAAGESIPRAPFASGVTLSGAPTPGALDIRDRSGSQPSSCSTMNRQIQPDGGTGPVMVHAAVTPMNLTNEILFSNPSAANTIRAGLTDGRLTISLGPGLSGANGCESEVDLSARLSPPATVLTGPMAGQTVRLAGLPVIGTLLQRVSNGTLVQDGARILSNYGVRFATRGELVVVAQ